MLWRTHDATDDGKETMAGGSCKETNGDEPLVAPLCFWSQLLHVYIQLYVLPQLLL